MPNNKVVLGDDVLIDISGDTVTPAVLLKGYTAHNAAGDLIEGELEATTSRLPDGYTELEYIEITDPQYVDTNFKPNQDTKVIVNLQITDLSIDKNNLIGARTSTSQNAYTVSTTDGCWRHGYGTATTATTKAVDAEWHEITMDKNKFYVDGVLINTETYKSFACPVTLTIGRINHGSTVYQGYARFGECEVYDNGVHARELIPCIKLSTMEKGMYDRQNNEFYTLIGQSTSQTVEQATPSIAVSPAGLITASATQEAGYVEAGTKSATKQLTTKGATTITPTSSVQTAVAAGTYCTGAIKVAASTGKQVYSGTFNISEPYYGRRFFFDAGITLSPTDRLILGYTPISYINQGAQASLGTYINATLDGKGVRAMVGGGRDFVYFDTLPNGDAIVSMSGKRVGIANASWSNTSSGPVGGGANVKYEWFIIR